LIYGRGGKKGGAWGVKKKRFCCTEERPLEKKTRPKKDKRAQHGQKIPRGACR